jgi:hypothetical protein
MSMMAGAFLLFVGSLCLARWKSERGAVVLFFAALAVSAYIFVSHMTSALNLQF